jgi:hypothetical protein
MASARIALLVLVLSSAGIDISQSAGHEPPGSIVISVRDVTTGYSLAANITISSVAPDGSEGPRVETFLIDRYQTVTRDYPPGNYLIDVTAEGYQPLRSSFSVEAGKRNGCRFMLSPSARSSKAHTS